MAAQGGGESARPVGDVELNPQFIARANEVLGQTVSGEWVFSDADIGQVLTNEAITGPDGFAQRLDGGQVRSGAFERYRRMTELNGGAVLGTRDTENPFRNAEERDIRPDGTIRHWRCGGLRWDYKVSTGENVASCGFEREYSSEKLANPKNAMLFFAAMYGTEALPDDIEQTLTREDLTFIQGAAAYLSGVKGAVMPKRPDAR